MKIKTSELTGTTLDWAVAKCEGMSDDGLLWAAQYFVERGKLPQTLRFHTWAMGGPIIEREGLNLTFNRDWVYDPEHADPDDEPDNGDRWLAEYPVGRSQYIGDYGPTPLVAAMRCYVLSKLGDEVEVPDALT